MRRLLIAALALVLAGPAPILAQAQDQAQDGALAQLQAQDIRLAQVAERIMTANAALCLQTMPITGLWLHSADQYGAGAGEALFPAGPLAAALVVPGSPAQQAGMHSGDTVVAIGGQDIAALAAPPDGHLREAAFDVLADQPSGAPFVVRFLRGGQTITAVITAPPGCRSLVEIEGRAGLMGRSDGRVIQISLGLAQMLDDDGLAVIFAHELSHTVLRHRARLEAAGVDKGLLGEFGRNRRLNRQVELEADRMSAHLLANAGYDPAIAPAFWKSASGRRAGGGFSLSFIYPAPSSRGDRIAEEIALYLPQGRGPTWPQHLIVLRDQPFAQ